MRGNRGFRPATDQGTAQLKTRFWGLMGSNLFENRCMKASNDSNIMVYFCAFLHGTCIKPTSFHFGNRCMKSHGISYAFAMALPWVGASGSIELDGRAQRSF